MQAIFCEGAGQSLSRMLLIEKIVIELGEQPFSMRGFPKSSRLYFIEIEEKQDGVWVPIASCFYPSISNWQPN